MATCSTVGSRDDTSPGEQLGLVELNARLLAEAMHMYPHCVVGDTADLIGALLHCRVLFSSPLVMRELLALVDDVERALIRRGIDLLDTGEGCDSLRLLVMAHDAKSGGWWRLLPAPVRMDIQSSAHALRMLCSERAQQQQARQVKAWWQWSGRGEAAMRPRLLVTPSPQLIEDLCEAAPPALGV